jgi:hypothetical protein
MKHYAGLDISVKETSICIVDETGQVRHEVKVASYPEIWYGFCEIPPGSWNAFGARSPVAVAVQRASGSGAAGGVHRDTPRSGLSAGPDQQE